MTQPDTPFRTMEPGTDDWWLDKLVPVLGDRQNLYQLRVDYANGNHPPPNADKRYVRALRDLQEKAQTNYIYLVINAVTQRMKVKGFKFPGSTGDPQQKSRVDDDAERVWAANNGALFSSIVIDDAATLGDCYALVAPPDEVDGDPVITAEDPRSCIVIPDPVNPFRSLVGLKMWQDDILERVFAVVYLPQSVTLYEAGLRQDQFRIDRLFKNPLGLTGGGFRRIRRMINPLGVVPLIRGVWNPTTGLAECDTGAFNIQDRINYTILNRLIITNSQAFRQRWMAGGRPSGSGTQRNKNEGPEKPPFDPGSDMVWWVTDPEAKFGDFEQANLDGILNSIDADVGDLAAITQTPSTYLTNKMINVSADTLDREMAGLVSKVHKRQEAMGWFLVQVMRLAFRYLGQEDKAKDPGASVVWEPAEVHSLSQLGDFVAKAAGAGIPIQLIMEKMGQFTTDEIEMAVAEAERAKQEQQRMAIEQIQAKPAPAPSNSNSKPTSGR